MAHNLTGRELLMNWLVTAQVAHDAEDQLLAFIRRHTVNDEVIIDGHMLDLSKQSVRTERIVCKCNIDLSDDVCKGS